MPPTALGKFRLIALVEGWSFLLLLCVGMPLKYLALEPLPNYVIGATHGGLFLLYVALMLWVARSRGWSSGWTAVVFGASLIPIGTFILDASLRRELAQEAASAPG